MSDKQSVYFRIEGKPTISGRPSEASFIETILGESEDFYIVEYDYVKVKERTHYPGKLYIGLNPLIFWICFLDRHMPDVCYGSTSDWEYRHEKRNIRELSDETRDWVAPKTPGEYSYTWVAKDEFGSEIARTEEVSLSTIARSGTSAFKIPFRAPLESLPLRPQAVELLITRRQNNGSQLTLKAPYDENWVAALELDAIQWKSKREQQRIYMTSLRSALISDDHHTAVKNYAALEALELPLPNSFYFRYAESLRKIYDSVGARKYYQTYLELAGSNGEYADITRERLGK
ncbi:hypothetical protein FHR99_000871 [Litorivivens lipolytica]|uniref:Uncharacterized protein n=1 Tax=Litorivivens lipolytica TaxID=1524264 RepID=A0A7W4W3G6_9GAMM|nr:hypothetical protein [Litorivivens lipolytica]MBB3046635.1 hypothetical protein [Litorivivens lipolytica]